MILECSAEDLRDIAAAVHAARKRQPQVDVMARVERKVMSAIQTRQEILELSEDEANGLRNVLLMRAHDQRNTSEAQDYHDLAERIGQDLEIEAPPVVEAPEDFRS